MSPANWFRTYVRDTDFLNRYPFYAGVLAQLECVSTSSVPVMAVRYSHRFQLLVNDAYFKQSPEYRAGVLLHEVHHLVLGHLTRPAFFDVPRPDIMQLAMEMSANEYIAEPLPHPIVCTDFERLGITAHQSTRERYDVLVLREDDIDPQVLRSFANLDDHDGKGGGIGIANVLRGEARPAGAAPHLHRLLQSARSTVSHRHLRPPNPRQEELDPGDRKAMLRRLLARAFERSDPGLLGRDVDAVIEELKPPSGPPKVDWRMALRAFCGCDPVRVWQRPDRRQPNRVFEVPGRTWRGHRPELLVAIDSSGSMGQDELGRVAAELRPLAAQATMTIVECDERVQRIYPFRGKLETICGRGGTDLRPPFEPELVRRYGRDGVVYFTDGIGPVPTTAPRVPVLWVIIGSEEMFACPFGRCVTLPLGNAPYGDPFGNSTPF